MRLWVDTDVGGDPDDAVALLCAVAHPGVELVGVSTVSGDTEWRAAVARGLVDAPVIAGPQLDAETVRAVQPQALLAIGPLTNLAQLLDDGYRPPRLALMGGTRYPVRHRGEDMAVEYNFASDPAAASAVLNDHSGTLLCPLDVTVRMRLTPDERARFVTADARLGPAFDDWEARTLAAGTPPEETGVWLHDPLALLALVGEPVLRTETLTLTVGPDGTIVETSERTEHEVVVDVDAPAAKARILALLEHGSQ
ncbi:MAG: nucleoside hydrolase [Acidimicrobiia bacterium]